MHYGEESLEEKMISWQLCNNSITNDVLSSYIWNVGADERSSRPDQHGSSSASSAAMPG